MSEVKTRDKHAIGEKNTESSEADKSVRHKDKLGEMAARDEERKLIGFYCERDRAFRDEEDYSSQDHELQRKMLKQKEEQSGIPSSQEQPRQWLGRWTKDRPEKRLKEKRKVTKERYTHNPVSPFLHLCLIISSND